MTYTVHVHVVDTALYSKCGVGHGCVGCSMGEVVILHNNEKLFYEMGYSW